MHSVILDGKCSHDQYYTLSECQFILYACIDHLVLLPLQLRHINNQWAQDYESLIQKMTANSTGYYSTPSSTTSHQQLPICTRCLQLEKKLDESRNEVCQITAKLETLQHTIHQRNRQVAHLENANLAIQSQVGCSESSSPSCNSFMFIDVY